MRILLSPAKKSNLIINLASKEYSRVVEKQLPPDVRLMTVVFGEHLGGRTVEKGTMRKIARGEMVRCMAENHIEHPDQMQRFDRLDYRFCAEESDENIYTFIKEA